MADIKKYYYMRLKENFFESEELVMLEAMTEGMLYSNILIKLYLKSLKNEGRLMFKDTIPYNAQMIATITRHQIGTVEKALIIFGDLGLIEVLDNGMIYMNDIELFIGKTTTEAERKKKARMAIENEKKALIGQMSDKCPNSNGQMSDKYPPENRVKSIESRVKSLETDNIPSKEVSQSVNDLDIHFKLAQNFYDDNIGNATPFICERIGYMVDENDHELVLEAMKLTVIAKPTRAVTYIESILKNWKKDRITNLKQLVLHQQVKEAKPSGLNNKSSERHSDNEYDGLSI